VRRRARRWLAGEAGQALVWAAVTLPLLFIPMVGLVIDGGVVLNARRDLQNVADAAARAGAARVDVGAYRASAGAAVVLDQPEARRAATACLAAQRDVSGTVRTDARRVVVEVSREVPTAFLRIAGLSSVRIGARAPAEARMGVDRPVRS
jgi:Flp pilus assembly protein TadG